MQIKCVKFTILWKKNFFFYNKNKLNVETEFLWRIRQQKTRKWIKKLAFSPQAFCHGLMQSN